MALTFKSDIPETGSWVVAALFMTGVQNLFEG